MILSDLASPAEAGFAKAGNRSGIMLELESTAIMARRAAPGRFNHLLRI
jgi:hypothetical protein